MSTERSDPARPTYDLVTDAHDYPAWDGPPLRTILICSNPRSGSTLLGEAMTFAGGLGCPLEYFHQGFRPVLEARWAAPGMRPLLAAVWRHRTDTSGTLSVKLFWPDLVQLAASLNPEAFAGADPLAADTTDTATYRSLASLIATCFPNPTYLHLSRRDRVRQAVSGFTAIQTGRWRDIPGLPVREGPQCEAGYDFDRIAALVHYVESCDRHWHNLFSINGIAPIEVTYEALARDYEGVTRQMLNALGSDAPAPPARMHRQADASHEALVLRFLRDRQEKASRASKNRDATSG